MNKSNSTEESETSLDLSAHANPLPVNQSFLELSVAELLLLGEEIRAFRRTLLYRFLTAEFQEARDLAVERLCEMTASTLDDMVKYAGVAAEARQAATIAGKFGKNQKDYFEELDEQVKEEIETRNHRQK